MEVEFLSNMRYSLLASKEQWDEWHQKLSRFWAYCDRALKAPVTLPSPTGVPNPLSLLPSPPTSMQASPPQESMFSATGTLGGALGGTLSYNQNWAANTYSVPTLTTLPPVPNLQPTASRKRTLEDDAIESAAKRVTRSAPAAGMVPFQPQSAPVHLRSDAPRLPVPQLTISTTQALNNAYPAVTSFPQSSPSVLPPLAGNRGSSAYPTTPSWTPQLPMLTPTNPQGPLSAGGFATPTRRQSPHSVQELLSIGSSPVSTIFPGYNPGHISPSIFLQQRASPYKPVRHVNALLYPPPSTMQNYSANIDHMHYLPLGKRNDYRQGIVPDYTSSSAYPWPVLPQPNFHA